MVSLFDSFDNVIGRPFDQMTEAHKKILAAQSGAITRQAQAVTQQTPLIQQHIDTPMSVASTPNQYMSVAGTPRDTITGTPTRGWWNTIGPRLIASATTSEFSGFAFSQGA